MALLQGPSQIAELLQIISDRYSMFLSIYSIQELERFVASILPWVIGNNCPELTSIDLLKSSLPFVHTNSDSKSYTHFCLTGRGFCPGSQGFLRVWEADILFAEISTVPDVPPKVGNYVEKLYNSRAA